MLAGQEAAWNAFAAAVQPGPRQPGIDRKAMREEFAQLDTPARLDRMQAMAAMRHARMAERVAATRAFYAQLTPEQQRVFDAEAMPLQHRGHDRPHPARRLQGRAVSAGAKISDVAGRESSARTQFP